jgi:hypothetical protein
LRKKINPFEHTIDLLVIKKLKEKESDVEKRLAQIENKLVEVLQRNQELLEKAKDHTTINQIL